MTIVDPLFEPEVVEDPHGYYAQLRATDPVHELPGTGTFLVTRMDLIHEVVAKPSVYSSVSGRFLHHRVNGGRRGSGALPRTSTSTPTAALEQYSPLPTRPITPANARWSPGGFQPR